MAVNAFAVSIPAEYGIVNANYTIEHVVISLRVDLGLDIFEFIWEFY